MIPPSVERYVLAKLLADVPLNGEMERVSEAWRPTIDYLAGLALDARVAAFEAIARAPGFDCEAIIRSLAEVDPLGPPPEACSDSAKPRYRLTRAADVTCRPVEWLWGPRVPSGMITMFAGDPKLGKSFVTIAISARVSRGLEQHRDDPPVATGSVVMLSAEDDPARTIVPRLKSADADLSKIHILESVFLANGSEALPSLRTDIRAIEDAVMSLGDCRLVVVDPVSAYLGGTDDHKNGELRGVLSPLKLLAERSGAAIILVSHLNKGSGTNGKHRVAGSIAYVGACRANFLFVRDREDETGRRVLMLANGCNLAGDVETLAYQIENRGDGPVLAWEANPVGITAEQALEAELGDPDERDERAECNKWLWRFLEDGPALQTDIVSAGKAAGFGLSTLNRAKRKIGAKTHREGFGKDSKCSWMLPEGPSTHGAGAP